MHNISISIDSISIYLYIYRAVWKLCIGTLAARCPKVVSHGFSNEVCHHMRSLMRIV